MAEENGRRRREWRSASGWRVARVAACLLAAVWLAGAVPALATAGERATARDRLVLLPEPQRLDIVAGQFAAVAQTIIHVPEELDRPERLAVEELRRVLAAQKSGLTKKVIIAEYSLRAPEQGIVLRLGAALDVPSEDPGAYRVRITPARTELVARSGPGLFYGIQTLIQVAESCGGDWPCLTIVDYPDFTVRGFYHDVTRGKVPNLDTMKTLVDRLARLKANQLQLYVEHVFDFQFDSDIGKGCSPLTADEIRELDAYCRDRRIDLVPSLASFGHMGRVLSLPQYRELAEVETTKTWEEMTWRNRMYGLTLDPTNPKSRELLEKMFAEFLPLFSSKLVNVCADETFDLGKGKNKAQAEKEGTGRLYLEHIQWLHALARQHGKRMMFWGDIVKRHPDRIAEIPDDAILLNWGYRADMNYDSTALFQQAGLATYVCPGCSGWNRFLNGINAAEQNIRRFAAAGMKYGAVGLLNTDWGDDGHVNFLACSWHPMYLGAAMGWNQGQPSPEAFDVTFGFLLFGQRDDRAAAALRRAARAGDRVDYWRSFYAPFDELRTHRRLTQGEARAAVRNGQAAAKVFAQYQEQGHGDKQDCTELVWACKMSAVAGEKVLLVEKLHENNGQPNPELAGRLEAFAAELDARIPEFETLWLARNKRSNVDDVLRALRRISAEAKQRATALKQE